MRKVKFAGLPLLVRNAVLACAVAAFGLALPALAAPPVRIAVVAAGGSGIEQEAADRISSQLDGQPNVVISTVNPDWYVVCNIQEKTDQMSGQIRYNGTVTVKTTDGQVISNIAVQKYNQDFSLQPGAQLNKALVDGAARDVIGGMSDRAVGPIQQAIQVEMDTRDRVIHAMELGDADNYKEAIQTVAPINPDSTHFKQVRGLIGRFQIEEHAKELMASAEGKAKQGKYAQAIGLLQQVDRKSKRHRAAVGKIGAYRTAMNHQHH